MKRVTGNAFGKFGEKSLGQAQRNLPIGTERAIFGQVGFYQDGLAIGFETHRRRFRDAGVELWNFNFHNFRIFKNFEINDLKKKNKNNE